MNRLLGSHDDILVVRQHENDFCRNGIDSVQNVVRGRVHGLAALYHNVRAEVDPEAEQDSELALAMLDATKHVRSGQVTYAARDSEFDGKKIKQGEYLSLCEGKLCANGKETSVIKKLAREMVSDDSAFATVIFGEGVTEEQAAEVENLLHKENKEMEINVIDGGQPVYYYIISVE